MNKKVALLVCDHVHPDLVDEFGDYPYMFGQLLPDLAMDSFFVCDGQFPAPASYDVFIATGSKYSVYEAHDWIKKLLAFTREVYTMGKQFVGICFGHQLLAEALGGKVEKAGVGYLIGIHHFKLDKSLPWLDHTQKDFNIIMLCQDQVTQLPDHAISYTSNPLCPIGLFTIDRQILGIQGHPEFSKAYNQAVFTSRPDKISPEKMEAAINSFDDEPDKQWLQQVIMGFIR